MTASEDELPFFLPVLIDDDLNIAQQFWDTLHFIDDDRSRILLQKLTRISLGQQTDIRILKIDVFLIGEL